MAEDLNNLDKGLIKQGYDDLIHPSAEVIGDIISYIPRTIRVWLGGFRKWLINGEESLRQAEEAIKDKVKDIPEDKLVEPESYVAIPAIQQLSYCQDSDVLRNLYANLLASSMNSDKKWKVHPAFVDILKQLNPDEAKMIGCLSPYSLVNYPLIDIRSVRADGGGLTILRNFTLVGIAKIDKPGNMGMYIDNLCRLDIIEIPPNMSLTSSSAYQNIENYPLIQEEMKRNHGTKVEIVHKCFNVTDFGANLIATCCNPQ